jgi:Zn-dependent M28 family amino/carboxypeptidase
MPCLHKYRAVASHFFMTYRQLIQQLDNKSNYERLDIIINQLDNLEVDHRKQEYSTGTNLIVDLGKAKKRIGVGSHFDRVQNSAGANDNGSAIAVCLDIIKKFKNSKNNDLGLRVFFFDEEETGLKGSTAYIKEHGTKDLIGIINMELVGLGDKFALWPVNEKTSGQILTSFESVSEQKKITSKRFDQIVTNTADHLPFQKAGLKDSFTITCISDKDIETAQHYFKALEFEVDKQTLFDILSSAPIFEHYHKPTDTFDKLSEDSILMTSATIWETIITVQKNGWQQ